MSEKERVEEQIAGIKNDIAEAKREINWLEVAAILSNPERDIKLQDLLKLKELTIKESMAITDTFIKIQEWLIDLEFELEELEIVLKELQDEN